MYGMLVGGAESMGGARDLCLGLPSTLTLQPSRSLRDRGVEIEEERGCVGMRRADAGRASLAQAAADQTHANHEQEQEEEWQFQRRLHEAMQVCGCSRGGGNVIGVEI